MKICRSRGFWYYLFTGVFEAATIHYAVAKIFGPLLFGRGLVRLRLLDGHGVGFSALQNAVGTEKKIGWIRYLTFAASLIFVAALFLAKVGNIERIMFWAFIIGNVAYYAVGIALAFAFKDNRAFCKIHLPDHRISEADELFFSVRVKCDKASVSAAANANGSARWTWT